ncbi:Acyltransferase family protein [Clostridium vincentii]|uniref:Acyltransferase family protein n=1 Tax=Clostridium vincentii TaxID=52704 RepID=A0A2T0BCX1_9CLOT|nr:acyltransferase family protein [Clostridium vincentii]PRR81750.1 Acyltransferase family protein [Clostridium vincentii]
MNENKGTRDKKIDVIKGIAIILVIIGHSIQVSKGSTYMTGLFYENPVFSIIYSFHMPLLVVIYFSLVLINTVQKH